MRFSQPRHRPERLRTAALRALLFVSAWVSPACQDDPHCEQGACPIGQRCVFSTGLCEDDPAVELAALPQFSGAWTLVGLAGLRHAMVGYDLARRSLAWVERDGSQSKVTWLAGPAAAQAQGAGETSAALVTATGAVHVVWSRRGDGTLWHATRTNGTWTTNQINDIEPYKVKGDLAFAPWFGRPTLAFEDATSGQAVVASLDAGGTWLAEPVPTPPPIAGTSSSIGGPIRISAHGAALSLAWYDPVGGDLVVATRGATWLVSRLGGRDPTTGADTSDAGAPCALTRDLDGGLIAAWRDRTAGEVRVARSAAGAIAVQTVSDGTATDTELGVDRRHVVGTALDVTILANGRLAVAWQDASAARIQLGVQNASGGFSVADVPASTGPQLRPRLLSRVDGTVLVGWLELDAVHGGGRPATWTWTPGGGTP